MLWSRDRDNQPTATRDHTERMLEFLGAKIEVDNSGDGRKIKLSGQLDSEVTYYDVPGDFSSTAFNYFCLNNKGFRFAH